jgi:CPA2 family monovalent cation:H+ antiporter-2
MVLAAVVVGVATQFAQLSAWIATKFGVSDYASRLVVIGIAAGLGAPLILGLVATARRLGMAFAVQALPSVPQGKLDLAAAPRRVLVTTLQLGIVLLAGIPLVVITQPFLPPLRGLAVLGALVLVLGFAFWRSAANLQGHARAGAEIVAASLAKFAAQREEEMAKTAEHEAQVLDLMLPGLGHPVPLMLPPNSPMLGQSLARINLRGNTGATILAIQRKGEQILVPSGSHVLEPGDVLALAGTHEAIARAAELLAPRVVG